ncbi:MAG: matrixin family metalloprotease [Deltaproteobacteria bacterium]|jgi:hypothetical protein|nr:matrixin family metalloprotease [Deltaproteobacteria bacterium]MBW2534993.1 matrixin family metalloprotease [Deltaproteobacteria bacterium]
MGLGSSLPLAPWWPAAAAAIALAAITPQAHAYCRTSVCDGERVGKVCEPAEPDDCGKPLFWAGRCVGYSVQQDASERVPWEVANDITEVAFDTWSAVSCAGASGPTIEGVNLGPVECATREYNQRGGNANLIVFRDDQWPYAGQWNTLALTTVTYNLDTGEIYDADLEVNSTNVELTWSDVGAQYDLPSIVTHEVGHVFGLAHSDDVGATMFSDYQVGSTALRDLAADDQAGICAIYPPGSPRADLVCDPTPRHGFKTDCGPGPEEDDGCSLGALQGRSAPRTSWLWAAGLALALATRRFGGGRPSSRSRRS